MGLPLTPSTRVSCVNAALFFEFFLKKGHDCNASSGRIFKKRSKSGMLPNFGPANPVKRALCKSKMIGFYYGKPKPQRLGTPSISRSAPETPGNRYISLPHPRKLGAASTPPPRFWFGRMTGHSRNSNENCPLKQLYRFGAGRFHAQALTEAAKKVEKIRKN